MDFTEFFQRNRPVLFDGALGTLLEARGYVLPPPVWSAAIVETEPETVTGIHREYIEAGARLITTATFRTTPRAWRGKGEAARAGELTRRAVQCAREARGDREDIFIAGSVAPLADCYRPDLVPESPALYREHGEQIRWLTDAGVDCLLIETMNTIREAAVCAELAADSGLPFFVSFICKSAVKVLNDEPVDAGVEAVGQHGPLAVLVNCSPPAVIGDIFTRWRRRLTVPFGGYANVGISLPEQGGSIDAVLSPEAYRREVAAWMAFRPALIGACCGSTPEHIRVLSGLAGNP